MTAEAANSVTGGTEMYPDPPLNRGREPNWDDYRIFGTVAKQRSLGRAAKALGVAKPTIRRRIASLESSIGTPLVDRSASGLALTQQGRQVADMVEAMAMIADSAMARVRIGEREVVGECKMVLGEGLSTAWFIPHFLGLFGDLYPRVIVHLAPSPDNDKISVPPYDIQIRYAPANDDNLLTFRIATFHFNYFASRRYVERFGIPNSQEDLADHRLIDVARSSGSDTGLLAQYSNIASLGRSYLFSNSGNMILQSVLAGHVIGLLPSYTYVVSPDLIPVLPDCHYETGLFINFSDAASGKKATRAMIDFLRNIVFDKMRMPWFGDRYETPNESWRAAFSNLVKTAGTFMPPARPEILSED